MGISLNPLAQDTNKMKYFVAALVFLAALVAAEPEAEAGYHGYGLHGYRGYGYSGYYNRGYYNRGYYGYRYPYRLHKRDADAEPGFHGLIRPVYAYHHYAPAASSYQHVSTPVASYGIHQLHKREAEAEAKPEAEAHHGLVRPVFAHPVFYRAPVASSYQHVSTPLAPYGIHQLHKREAEPEAHYYGSYYRSAYPSYYRYGGYRYGYPGYGYRSGYYGYH